jgi:very-short-patch-repair endonuclease
MNDWKETLNHDVDVVYSSLSAGFDESIASEPFLHLQVDFRGVEDLFCSQSLSNPLRTFHNETCHMSPIERRIYVLLRLFGCCICIEPQYKVGTYRADFRVTNPFNKRSVIVECDGHLFHEKTKQQAAHDKKRDRYFAQEGHSLLRFTGSEIMNNSQECLTDIFKFLDYDYDHEECLPRRAAWETPV